MAREYHVAMSGTAGNEGSISSPFRTISAAAALAEPGDSIIVHEGIYRERIDPPRGGLSDSRRITYKAAEGEKVVIKGSEPLAGWEKVQFDTWKTTVNNKIFGEFNPYSDRIHGDWFSGGGREHHTGAVYLNGHWLTEAIELAHVLTPIGEAAMSYAPGGKEWVIALGWIGFGDSSDESDRVLATDSTTQSDVFTFPRPDTEERFIVAKDGDWARYDVPDGAFGQRDVALYVAGLNQGGQIEIRRNDQDGELIGTCAVTNTGSREPRIVRAKIAPLRNTDSLYLEIRENQKEIKEIPDVRLWYAEVAEGETTIWAQFKEINPNEEEVEFNVRKSVFYPTQTGVNYLTISGFAMMHAATPWAPPTAEQVGLIGTNWSKGWIIEKNDISYSVCSGIALGKHGDEYDNTSANSAESYVDTIHRALEKGWSEENIGGHIARSNCVSYCEQTGIVGSLGAAFSTVTENVIHDIHLRALFGGAEMAGIKFHGAIDTVISRNHIYRTVRGIWLDWMAQGTRVTYNVLHDNGPRADIFVEVNQGPFLIDNNIMLSRLSVMVNSHGGAYVHNLIAGEVRVIHDETRQTPYHTAHSTELAGLNDNPSGDDRYFNNVFINGGLGGYDDAALPVFMEGNVFLNGAVPSKHEHEPLVLQEVDPGIKLADNDNGIDLHFAVDSSWGNRARKLVNTKLLGKAKTPNLEYEKADGTPYRLVTDYHNLDRDEENPFPGPFKKPDSDSGVFTVWPPGVQ